MNRKNVGDAPLTAIGHLFGGFSGSSSVDAVKSSQIAVGTYDVELFLFKKPVTGHEIIIPPQERSYGPSGVVDLVTGSEEKHWVPEQPITFVNGTSNNTLFLGKAKFEDFVISSDMLSSRGVNMNFKIPYLDLGKACKDGLCVVEDLSETGSVGEYVDLYPDIFVPVVVKK